MVSAVLASQDKKQYSQNNVELSSISEAEETIINSHVVENVKEDLQYLKKAGTLTESCRNAYRVGTALIISFSSKQLRKVSSVARRLDLNPSVLTKRCEEREKIIGGEEGSWLALKRKTRCNSIGEETKKVMHKYQQKPKETLLESELVRVTYS